MTPLSTEVSSTECMVIGGAFALEFSGAQLKAIGRVVKDRGGSGDLFFHDFRQGADDSLRNLIPAAFDRLFVNHLQCL